MYHVRRYERVSDVVLIVDVIIRPDRVYNQSRNSPQVEGTDKIPA